MFRADKIAMSSSYCPNIRKEYRPAKACPARAAFIWKIAE
jgi:hypothetical protein